MLKLAVLVSGGGTNLQAIIDAIENGAITNAKIELVISNNKNAFALERAARSGIPARCISPRDYNSREQFEEELLETLLERQVDLVVLLVLPFIACQEEVGEGVPRQQLLRRGSLIRQDEPHGPAVLEGLGHGGEVLPPVVAAHLALVHEVRLHVTGGGV